MDPAYFAIALASTDLANWTRPEEINAAYSQMLADGMTHIPSFTKTTTIQEWRDAELARIANGT